jgi:hypothetical protein
MAIIMTRTGAEAHALAMTQGAMREQGKLILIVNDEKVCEMLHMKERGKIQLIAFSKLPITFY